MYLLSNNVEFITDVTLRCNNTLQEKGQGLTVRGEANIHLHHHHHHVVTLRKIKSCYFETLLKAGCFNICNMSLVSMLHTKGCPECLRVMLI